MVGILSLAIMAVGATATLAAPDASALGEIKELYRQMFDIQKQITDKQAEAGIITPDQATSIKSAIDERTELQDQAIDNGQVYGPGMMGGGYGMGYGMHNEMGYGAGYGMGYGMGYGHMGGWGYQAPANSTVQPDSSAK